MAGKRSNSAHAKAIKRALALTTEALDLLDAHDGPPDAAAHLEMCRHKLQQEIAYVRSTTGKPTAP